MFDTVCHFELSLYILLFFLTFSTIFIFIFIFISTTFFLVSSTFFSIYLSGALSAPTTTPGGSNLVGDPIELAAMKGAV